MKKLGIQDLSIAHKKVLMRVDFNIPLSPDLTPLDISRLKAAIPSIEWVLKQGGSLVLMSHLGRPKGKKEARYSLHPCALALEALLKKPVLFAEDCVGSSVKQQSEKLQPGEILLLENLRFHPAEEKPSLDPLFAKELSDFGDVYVDDAFGAAHRAHSSICPITSFFPGKAAAGFLIQKEIENLDALLGNPHTPFYVILGGAKVSSKITLLQAIAPKTNGVFIGGAMAFTFLKSQGYNVGSSLVEEDHLETAKEFLELCHQKQIPVYLPEDLVITQEISPSAEYRTLSIKEGIPKGWEGVDIGPKTQEKWKSLLEKGQTIFWNGPVGVFEIPQFAKGTFFLTSVLAKLKNVLTIAGGGDVVAAIEQTGLGSHFSFLSTGGGASLEYLEQGHLPGIDALSNK